LGFAAVYALSEWQLRDKEPQYRFTATIPGDAASIERGRHIARTRSCFGCHGQELEGHDFDEQWDWPKRAVAPNLASYARATDRTPAKLATLDGLSTREFCENDAEER